MTSKDRILAAIRANKPAAAPLPALPAFDRSGVDAVQAFIEILPAVGAEVIADATAVADWSGVFQRISPGAPRVLSLVPGVIAGNVDPGEAAGPRDLEHIDIAVIPGELGVAENGAVWVSERSLPFRVLPFIAQHLVLVVPRAAIVADMHEAYRRIAPQDAGFGVFIAGPSKTADIEQSLVKGAQGARTTLVVIAP